MSPQKNQRSLQILGCLGLIVSLLGGYAIAAPEIKKNLPCVVNCANKKADELLNNKILMQKLRILQFFYKAIYKICFKDFM